MNEHLDFYSDLKKGKQIEEIFLKQYDYYFNKDNKNPLIKTSSDSYQPCDFINKGGFRYEIKSSYNCMNNTIIIEEHSKGYQDNILDGWWYKLNQYDKIVFMPNKLNIDKCKSFVILYYNNEVKDIYEYNKISYQLKLNKPTSSFNDTYYNSTFRIIPISIFNGHYEEYNLIKELL
jgi:hypothetical protein